MGFDEREIEAAVALLIEEMEGDQGDAHEIYLRLRQILDQMRAMNMPPPDDLVRLERELSAAFSAEAPAPPKGEEDGDGDGAG